MNHDIEIAEAVARQAHEGQFDKAGMPYIYHPQAVAYALYPISPVLSAAGWLHDVVEDTDWTLDDLLRSGLSGSVVSLVDTVTRRDGETYDDFIDRVSGFAGASVLKLCDNLHNSRPGRIYALDQSQASSMGKRYAKARTSLLQVVDHTMAVDICNRLGYPVDSLFE